MNLRDIPLIQVMSALGYDKWKSRKNGTEFYGRCVIHNPKNNSSSFSFDEHRFHCFSCRVKGKGAIDLLIALGRSYNEAVTFLETIDGSKTSKIVENNTPENKRPFKGSYEKFAVKSEWLEKRGFTEETLKRFGVFQYDNPKRQSAYKGCIMFPVRDGDLLGYLVRRPNPLASESKYVFPKGVAKGQLLFGLHELRQSGQQLPLRVVYLVESPFCVMKFHQLGFPAVSAYGWSLTPHQAALVGQVARGVVVLPDSDKRNESLSSVAPLLAQHCWVKYPAFEMADPEGLNPEQISRLR